MYRIHRVEEGKEEFVVQEGKPNLDTGNIGNWINCPFTQTPVKFEEAISIYLMLTTIVTQSMLGDIYRMVEKLQQ